MQRKTEMQSVLEDSLIGRKKVLTKLFESMKQWIKFAQTERKNISFT